ncbi:hypothetical protein BC832DRAFT_225769 [Gaertneriomyces semiglobifer]|nr:hypothetical protein BC832DRAFT_225769 [Gaertneriomyces semiglobifer]
MLGGCDEADCQMMWKLTARTSSSFAFSRVTFGTSAQIAAPTTFRIETQDQSTTTISDCTILSATYLHPLNYGTSALNISSLRMVEASKSALTAYLYGSATMHFRDSILIDQVTWRGAQAVVTVSLRSLCYPALPRVLKHLYASGMGEQRRLCQ